MMTDVIGKPPSQPVRGSDAVPPPIALAPTLSRCALLLDIDGTLLDLAPTPDAVVVPPELARALRGLHERTSGALALVSGRSLGDIDAIFAPMRLPGVGGHGAQLDLEMLAAPRRIQPNVPSIPSDAALAVALGNVRAAAEWLFHHPVVRKPDGGPVAVVEIDCRCAPRPSAAQRHRPGPAPAGRARRSRGRRRPRPRAAEPGGILTRCRPLRHAIASAGHDVAQPDHEAT